MGISGRFIVENEGKAGTIKVLGDPETKTLLGVHIIGDPASEIIYGVTGMIEAKMKLSGINKIVFPHPTVSEVLKEAISQLAH
jgi:dihydrolipoamide dehydrogenase